MRSSRRSGRLAISITQEAHQSNSLLVWAFGPVIGLVVVILLLPMLLPALIVLGGVLGMVVLYLAL